MNASKSVEGGRPSYRGVIEDVLSLADDIERARLGSRKDDVFVAIHGLVMHAFEGCRAVLLLSDNNQPAMVDVIARVVLEHAVTAQWLAIEPQRLPEYLRHISAKQQTFINALDRDDFPLPEEVRANWLGAKIPASPTLNRVEQMFQQLVAPSLYPQVYRYLSTTVHPSEYTLTHYATIDDGAPRSFNKRRTRQDYESALWVIAFSSVLALSAYVDLFRSKPYKRKITVIAAASPTPLPLWLTTDGKAPRNRRYDLAAVTRSRNRTPQRRIDAKARGSFRDRDGRQRRRRLNAD